MVEATEPRADPAVSPTCAAAPKPPRHTEHFHTRLWRDAPNVDRRDPSTEPLPQRWQLTDRDRGSKPHTGVHQAAVGIGAAGGTTEPLSWAASRACSGRFASLPD
jgi:hypothetical protein